MIAVFSPSLRNVPFSGVEWSYQMKDLGFNEKGLLERVDDEEFDEVNGAHEISASSGGAGGDIELTEITTSSTPL